MAESRLARALQRELDEWSAKSYTALIEELRDVVAFERSDEDGALQVEVQLLEHTAGYVHVSISVDDGGWRAFLPLTESFLVYRGGGGSAQVNPSTREVDIRDR